MEQQDKGAISVNDLWETENVKGHSHEKKHVWVCTPMPVSGHFLYATEGHLTTILCTKQCICLAKELNLQLNVIIVWQYLRQ
jgi:hypothetical protein